MVPLKPPPPNMTTLLFQLVGSATLNRMSGAVVSTGEILPLTRQCSGTAAAPVPAAGTSDVAVTVAPRVGRPITLAGISKPTIWSHFLGSGLGVDLASAQAPSAS